jgi:hypothetical protein
VFAQFGAVFHSHSVPKRFFWQLNPAEPLRFFTSVEAVPKNGRGIPVVATPFNAPMTEQDALPS